MILQLLILHPCSKFTTWKKPTRWDGRSQPSARSLANSKLTQTTKYVNIFVAISICKLHVSFFQHYNFKSWPRQERCLKLSNSYSFCYIFLFLNSLSELYFLKDFSHFNPGLPIGREFPKFPNSQFLGIWEFGNLGIGNFPNFLKFGNLGISQFGNFPIFRIWEFGNFGNLGISQIPKIPKFPNSKIWEIPK